MIMCLHAGLDLSHNRLSTLPSDLLNLRLLEDINLSSNLFESLPPVILEMVSLKKVDASHNRIVRVSKEELSSMVNLELLDLTNNPLDEGIKDQLATGPVAKVTISF